ncbi:MAG: acyl-CoA/acyl-ACP dehydrogenase [Dehalococcoidales bacterium]|nr:acyl-CoA/acyl-ACP dehydrogenase [Dehalococcoidales bacterium]
MDFNIPEDMKMVQTMARDFVKNQLIPLERQVLGRDSDLTGARQALLPETEEKLVKMVQDMGLWGLSVPEALGGVGLGVLGTCLVEEELAKTIVPFNFGDVTPVLFDCNEKQKAEYLMPLLERQKHAYLALIEPGKGTDPNALEMKAEKVNGDYILKGKKVAFAKGKADFAIVFAVTDPQKSAREGVTCFLVDGATPGFSITDGGEKTGWQAQVAEPITLVFDNCKVSADKILGEEGKAFNLGKKYLPTRRIVRGVRCVGAAVRLLDVCTEHAKSWQSFGKVISGWPSIQAALSDIAIDIHAARLMVYDAAWKADEGHDIHQEAAMVKVFSTEMLKRVADRTVQVRGGPAPARELPLETLCQSMLVQNVGERALEVQRSIIAGDILKLGTII